jgi:hypothetical protein
MHRCKHAGPRNGAAVSKKNEYLTKREGTGVCCASPCIAVAGALIRLIWLRASLAWIAEDAEDNSSQRGGRSDATLSGKLRNAAFAEEGLAISDASATVPVQHEQSSEKHARGRTFRVTVRSSGVQLRVQARDARHDPLLLARGHHDVGEVANESAARILRGIAHAPAIACHLACQRARISADVH